jgi:hypothetical protein
MFKEALDEAIAEQATLVTEETEVSKFLAALSELTATRPDLFMSGDIRFGTEKVLGRLNDRGLFVCPTETLAVMRQLGVFTQVPTVRSLTNALLEENLILPSREPDHKLYQTTINKTHVRGWMFVPNWNTSNGDPNRDPKTGSDNPNTRNTRNTHDICEREKREKIRERN